MAQQTPVGNPFQLMLDPEVVLAAIERSERLSQLHRRECRPLDRPLLEGGDDRRRDALTLDDED